MKIEHKILIFTISITIFPPCSAIYYYNDSPIYAGETLTYTFADIGPQDEMNDYCKIATGWTVSNYSGTAKMYRYTSSFSGDLGKLPNASYYNDGITHVGQNIGIVPLCCSGSYCVYQLNNHYRFSVIAAGPRPVTDFTAIPLSGPANLTVTFNDTSTNNPTQWRWYFGDGKSSVKQNISHIYTTPGVYSVSHGAKGSSDWQWMNRTDYINVTPRPPIANFTGEPRSGPAPLTVQFNDTSTRFPTFWNWTFGDGKRSTEQNPSHTYEAAGTYTVTLRAANTAGGNRSVKEGYISVTGEGPVADFSADPTSGNCQLIVRFMDNSTGSPISWNWSFGDGIYSTDQNPSHTYRTADDYTVGLTVTNALGENTKTMMDYVSVICPSYISCDIPDTNPYINFMIENVSCPESNSGAWKGADCLHNAVIRCARAGTSTPFYSDLSPWMWKHTQCCPDPGHSWAVATPFNKPVYYAKVYNSDIIIDGKVLSHAVAAEYKGTGDVRNSTPQDWRFFQYENLDITVGDDWQIPNGTSTEDTEVVLKEIYSVSNCGNPMAIEIVTFTIDENNNTISYPNLSYSKVSIAGQSGKSSFKDKDIPIDLKEIIRSVNENRQFIISKWEIDPVSKELLIYVYKIRNQRAIDDIHGRTVGKYSIRIVYDTESEKKQADVQKQLAELKNNPDYQISSYEMVIGPNGPYAVLWCNELTPENKKLENTIMDGWRIVVSPISYSPRDIAGVK